MFVFLSKFLPLLIYPLGLACLLMLLSLILRIPSMWQKRLIILALVLLWLGGNRWVAYGLTYSLERKVNPPAELPPADVIIVLGGGTESFDAPRSGVEVNGAGDRVIHAVRLYRKGIAPYILLSGGNIEWLSARTTTPAFEMKELMLFMGVPDLALILQEQSRNTAEDVLFSARIIKERGFEKVILVTSAQHMPRSVDLFRAQGIDVIPSPADYSITDVEWQSLWQANLPAQLINVLPNAGNLSMTTTSLKEYLGMMVNSLRVVFNPQ